MAIESVSSHSCSGTSALSLVYTRMLNTVGSYTSGRKVTEATICLIMCRISFWISASGFGGALRGCGLKPWVESGRKYVRFRALLLGSDKVDIKRPTLERSAGVLREEDEDELGDIPFEQPGWNYSIRHEIGYINVRTIYLLEDAIEIGFECGVLCEHDRLAIFFDHFKVVCWVYTTLEEDATRRRVWSILCGGIFGD